MRVFYSHSLGSDLEPKVDFFRSLLERVKIQIEEETAAKGADKALTVEIVLSTHSQSLWKQRATFTATPSLKARHTISTP